jgi:hypothetical protein
MDGNYQSAFAYGAREAISSGAWDRYLLALRIAIWERELVIKRLSAPPAQLRAVIMIRTESD